MNRTIMYHYGRGAAHVPMPTAIAREARKEWFISPSLVLMILTVVMFVFFKMTVDNKKLFKDSRTIIILPEEAPKVPEPTVKKKLPLIKVLKDAVKKTVEPKKLELKKIPPPKPKPKKVKPKPVKPKSVAPKKVKPKKIDIAKIKKKPLVAPKPVKPKALKAPSVQPKAIQTPKVTQKTPEVKKLPISQVKPKALTPSKPVATKSLLKKPSAPQAFVPLAPPTATAKVPSPSSNRIVAKSSIPVHKGPVPKLTQRSEPTAITPNLAVNNRVQTGPPVAKKRVSVMPAPKTVKLSPSKKTLNLEELVVIESTILEHSARVKNLRRAILEKAKYMSPEKSPYKYKIKGFLCIVTIDHQGIIVIKFEPKNAPFEVISALERKLPNRR